MKVRNALPSILVLSGMVVLFFSTLLPEVTSAVTFELGDRLGDNLASYCHARWVSHKYGIPLRVMQFTYSRHLLLSQIHKPHNPKDFSRTVKIGGAWTGKVNLVKFNIKQDTNTLYVVPFFPESPASLMKWRHGCFDIDWKDEEFIRLLREEIKPIPHIKPITIPKDHISVAVHLRKGSGPDFTRYDLRYYPLRFLPDSFFIEQIQRVSDSVDNKPLYVHLFTDYSKPHELVEKYTQLINRPHITFGCCPAKRSELGVLEDFFNLMEFDCIIRPDSHFSQIAANISRARTVIFPSYLAWQFDPVTNKHELISKGVETIVRN